MTHKKINGVLFVLVILLGGYFLVYTLLEKNVGESLEKESKTVIDNQVQKSFKATLYLPDDSAKFLTESEETVNAPKDPTEYEKIQGILQTYIEKTPWIDPDTTVDAIFIKGKSLYLDFSSEVESKFDTPEITLVVVNGIVDTVVKNCPNIQEVKILVDGHENNLITENVGTSDFFKYDSTFIKKSDK